VARHVYLPLITFAAMGFIFPGVSLLARWLGAAKPGELASCSDFSFELAGALLLVLAVTTMAWPLALKRLNSALYAMAWAFPVTATLGLWFYLGGLGVSVCKPLPRQSLVLLVTNAIGLISVCAVFWLFFRARLRRVVDSNPQKWDFVSMKYSLVAPALPLDSARRFGLAQVLGIAAVLLGAHVALGYVLGRSMSVPQARAWEGVIVVMLLAYLAMLLALGQAYTMWIVHKRCKAAGRKMTIREFSR
jgi:uncharacterized membrane protein YjfL (UPF0719 family)